MNEETFVPVVPILPSIPPELFTLFFPILFGLAIVFAIGSFLMVTYHWFKYAGNFPLAVLTITAYGGGLLFLLVALQAFLFL